MSGAAKALGEVCRGLADCLERAPAFWWRRSPPRKQRLCYRRKSDALRLFLDENWRTIESYGGAGQRESCEEFDSINHEYAYGFKRRPCARSIAEAAWYALRGSGHRGGPPFCLDEIDLERLNDTDPGKYHGGFRLPAVAEEVRVAREEERYYEERAMERGDVYGCHTVYRGKRGAKRGKFTSRRNGRERQCVCRDERGRFKKCGAEPQEEIPF